MMITPPPTPPAAIEISSSPWEVPAFWPDREEPVTPTPASRSRSNQSVKWCFTLNNYTEADQGMLRALGWDANVKYLTFGREVGASGTPHLQGFMLLATRRRFNTVRAWLPSGCHLEPARGTAWEAAQYCWKDEDFEEFGSLI